MDQPFSTSSAGGPAGPAQPDVSLDIAAVVAQLRAVRERRRMSQQRLREVGACELPSREAPARIVAGLRGALFPMRLVPPDLRQESEACYVGHTLDTVLGELLAHGKTGIHMQPGARIGLGFFIDHGAGGVIGETAEIGRNVRLCQAVTPRAKRFATDADGHLKKGGARHPVVEDKVVVYAGAAILGRVTFGRGSTIGGNVWLTHSVRPGSHVSQALVRDDARDVAHARERA